MAHRILLKGSEQWKYELGLFCSLVLVMNIGMSLDSWLSTSLEFASVQIVNSTCAIISRFHKPFTLETDASIQGLGAILSQVQNDGYLHPLAYASRSLSHSEKNYVITELEALAVV